MADTSLSKVAAVVGVGHTDYRSDWTRVRNGEKPRDSVGYAADAFKAALADAGLRASDIDGLIVGNTTPYERMGEVLGLDVKWGAQGDAMLNVIQACLAIKAGLCENVALVYGNNQRSGGTNSGASRAPGRPASASTGTAIPAATSCSRWSKNCARLSRFLIDSEGLSSVGPSHAAST